MCKSASFPQINEQLVLRNTTYEGYVSVIACENTYPVLELMRGFNVYPYDMAVFESDVVFD